MTEYPISATCPQCGGTEYTCRKPERLVAFVSDRVCRACNTRYTPPTPVWAAVLFIVIGAIILLVNIAAVWVGFVMGGDFWLALRTYVFLLLTLSTGVGCVVYGLRRLWKQGDTPSAADGSRTTEATVGNR